MFPNNFYIWNGSQMNTYIWKSIKCKQTTDCKQIADCKQTAECKQTADCN